MENREKSQSEAITNNNINRETIGNSHNDAKLYASENNATKETPKEVLFFIHGVGGSLDVWKSQLDYFSGLGYEVISPDLIGHGMSCAPDQPRAYHFQEILADIEVIFDTYCKEKNIVVGHSYGCAFATVLARRRTRRVSKLVLVSGGGPVPLAPQAGIFSLPLCMLYCIRPCIMCTFRRSAFYSGSGKREENKQTAFDVPAYVLSYIMNGQWWLDGDELFHSWINVPTLLIWGRHDKFVGLQEEEDMLKVVYGSRLEIIETAGHMVMMEAPSEFNHILYHFIIDSPLPAQTTQDKSAVNSNSETSVGHPSNQNTKDKVAEWATPRGNKTKHNMGSRVSMGSVLSYKSTKSSKSMPQGVLSHHSKKS
ncbi:hypothetical protein FSP39_020023 [Pinctada imbricata]|uniref:acylglycerol lipase n=1 Tax=Pinctada imbricata TaxID=66713 RepID=A0AA88Y5F9_PINIB|nr:hypothetical protein FSP39_020023 [Pinctada imbricata]